jgi:uncharacterized protein (TIGR00255 family)
MPTISMTGFGRSQGEKKGLQLLVEIRSVNHRFADVVFRLPNNFPISESELGKLVKANVTRGRIEVLIQQSFECLNNQKIIFKKPNFENYLSSVRSAYKLAGVKYDASVAVANALTHREILDFANGEDGSQVVDQKWAMSIVKEALKKFTEHRRSEGKALEAEIVGHLKSLQALLKKIIKLSANEPKLAFDRLSERVEKLLSVQNMDRDRLMQEVAFLADKADITEEISRLGIHVDQFYKYLQQSGGGRKLDFLIQEIVRELNTIGSKSQQSEITMLVVEGKSTVEKLREQVQNIE